MDNETNRRFVDEPTTGLAYPDELFARRIAVARGSAGPFMMRAHQVLVRVANQTELRTATAEATRLGLEVVRPKGFRAGSGRRLVLQVEPSALDVAGVKRWSAAPVADAIAELEAAGLVASPNFVSFAHPGAFLPNPGGFLPNPGGFLPNPGGFLPNPGGFLPNSTPPTTFAQPAEAPAGIPDKLALAGRTAPIVLILDTGLTTRAAPGGGRAPQHAALSRSVSTHTPWLDDVPGEYDDEDEPDDDSNGLVDLAAGHGTFIAGIVRMLCPDAVVHTEGVLSGLGDGDDDAISAGIIRAVDRIGADTIDVIVMSFGTNTDDDSPPPMAETLAQVVGPDTLLVASAGNDGTNRPQFPAALPGVVAVGALHLSGRAGFSNFGGWVDACAPGVDVVSTYFTDFAEQDWPQRHFTGWASWSGTSFTAPKVAAAVAQEMYLHGGTAVEAWKRLSHWSRYRFPDLGVVFNV